MITGYGCILYCYHKRHSRLESSWALKAGDTKQIKLQNNIPNWCAKFRLNTHMDILAEQALEIEPLIVLGLAL